MMRAAAALALVVAIVICQARAVPLPIIFPVTMSMEASVLSQSTDLGSRVVQSEAHVIGRIEDSASGSLCWTSTDNDEVSI